MRKPWFAVLIFALLVAIPGFVGTLPVAAAEGPTLALVEDYAYPGADAIVADGGPRLVSGDGHVVLVACPPTGGVRVWSRGWDHEWCFDITGAAGYLGLDIPQTYSIRADGHAITATVSINGQQKTVTLRPNDWNGVGEGNSEDPATLLALDARPVDGSDATIPVDPAHPFVGRLTVGKAGQVGAHGCSASLVSPFWVVSAASCFAADPEHPATEPFAPSVAASVRFGGRAAVPVTYVLPRVERDVVLAKLATPVIGIDPVRPAAAAPAVNAQLSALGYGRTGTAWAEDTQTTNALTVSEVAATTLTGTAPVCKGSAGGPVLDAGGALAGVLTRGGQAGCLGSASTGTGAVATRADNLAAWINQEVYPELARPQLNLAVRKNVSVSSAYVDGAWDTPKAVDGQRESTSTSLGWSSSGENRQQDHTEWIQVDLGTVQQLGRVDLFPRSDGADAGYGFPVDFTIQVSDDSVNWVTAVTRTGYARPTAVAQQFGLGGNTARFIKITGTKLQKHPATGDHYLQFAEIEVYGANLATGRPVTVSSAYSWEAWAAPNATDGQRSSMGNSLGWSSTADNRLENHTEWISVDLGRAQPLGRVDLFPRSDGADAGYGFPIDFTIQVSPDGTNWTTAVTRTGYARPNGSAQSFGLAGRNARYLKVTGTNLPRYPTGEYYLQLGEIEVYGANLATGRPVSTSSVYPWEAWGAANATDGQRASMGNSLGWSSGPDNRLANHTEWISVDLGTVQPLGRVDLFPRSDGGDTGYGFPVDFTIQLSIDGMTWSPSVVTRSGYARPDASAQSFGLGGRTARYLKITGTSLPRYPTGEYYLQLAEIEVYGANLATGKPATVSSAYPWEAWGTPNATDGQRASMGNSLGWSSGPDGRLANHTEWISVDLGQVRSLNRVDLVPRSDGVEAGYGFPVDFTVQISDNGTNWTTVATRTGYGRPSPVAQPFPMSGRNARYIKVVGTSLQRHPRAEYFMQLAEIEIS